MATVVQVPRDKRFGQIGKGLGQITQSFLQKRAEDKKNREKRQTASRILREAMTEAQDPTIDFSAGKTIARIGAEGGFETQEEMLAFFSQLQKIEDNQDLMERSARDRSARAQVSKERLAGVLTAANIRADTSRTEGKLNREEEAKQNALDRANDLAIAGIKADKSSSLTGAELERAEIEDLVMAQRTAGEITRQGPSTAGERTSVRAWLTDKKDLTRTLELRFSKFFGEDWRNLEGKEAEFGQALEIGRDLMKLGSTKDGLGLGFGRAARTAFETVVASKDFVADAEAKQRELKIILQAAELAEDEGLVESTMRSLIAQGEKLGFLEQSSKSVPKEMPLVRAEYIIGQSYKLEGQVYIFKGFSSTTGNPQLVKVEE
jgi:hypothetical protein